MKISLLAVGATSTGYIRQGIDLYSQRISHYAPLERVCTTDARNTRNMTNDQQKSAEGKALLSNIAPGDHVVLLDEHGTQRTSMAFSQWLQRRMASGTRRLVFVVGGPYGFSCEVYSRANEQISLSDMTLPHELVRLVFVEQLYRAFTILRNEPYHHQ